MTTSNSINSGSSITWHLHGLGLHSFSNGELIHLFFNPLFIPNFFLFHSHFLFIFFSLFLINLCLKLSFHILLFNFTFVLHNKFFISALAKNVSIFLKFKINSVIKYTTSSFHIRKVLFCKWSIETRVSVTVLCGLGLLIHVECFVILNLVQVWRRHIKKLTSLKIILSLEILRYILLWTSILRILCIYWLLPILCIICHITFALRLLLSCETRSFRFSPFFFFPKEISFFNLFFKFFCEGLLFAPFVGDLIFVGIGINCETLATNYGVLMDVFFRFSEDIYRWIRNRFNSYNLNRRIRVKLISRTLNYRLMLRETARLQLWILLLLLSHIKNTFFRLNRILNLLLLLKWLLRWWWHCLLPWTWLVLKWLLLLHVCPSFLSFFPHFHFFIHDGIIIPKCLDFTHVYNRCGWFSFADHWWVFLRLWWLTSRFSSCNSSRIDRCRSLFWITSISSRTSWVVMRACNTSFVVCSFWCASLSSCTLNLHIVVHFSYYLFFQIFKGV